MKKIISLVLCITLLSCVLCACSGKKESNDPKEASLLMPTVIDTVEYTLYQNIFYNNKADEYSGQKVSKQGTFTTLQDAYSNVTRYYVWGYNDNTKCCDWQWEIKLDDEKNIPSNGSLVTVDGTYEKNDSALDGLWIVNPVVNVTTKYNGNGYDVDMLTMSNTLERVQIANVQDFPEQFSGKTIGFYGRMKNDTEIEDPYYDNSWSVKVTGDFEVPAFGTTVVANGKVGDDGIENVTVGKNTQY